MEARSSLPIRRELIDAKFEGYKLSLDCLPTYQCSLESVLDVTSLSEDQYSFHHAKLLGVHNHLIQDPWCNKHVYFVSSDWFIVKAMTTMSSVQIDGRVVQIPDSAIQREVIGRHEVTMVFVSPDLAVVSDGAGKLHVYFTGDRQSSAEKWKVLFSLDPVDGKAPFSLVDSLMTSDNGTTYIDCLCAYVIESNQDQKEKFKSNHLSVIDWVTIVSSDQKSWKQERSRQLLGRRPFDYVAMDSNQSVVIAAPSAFKFHFDSLKPVLEEEVVESHTIESALPEYTWCQESEDITVQFTVPAGMTKADIYLTLTSDHIDFGIKNGKALLKGHLHGPVDVEGSTWTIQEQRVELTLTKLNQEVWPVVVVGDHRGEMTLDQAQIAEIHNRLAGLTSEQLNPAPDPEVNKPYNAQELEDCDAFPDDSSMVTRMDGNSHKVTHQTNLGSHQFLFTTRVSHDAPSVFCLRHDVDGLVWQPAKTVKEHDSPWQHVATFNAFGYVQASKQQRKFCACSSDFSYVAICDAVRHCYIYRQPTAVLSPVRNRKTGQQINTVAKQQVVSLESADSAVGLHATHTKLFILTTSKLYAVLVNPETV
ncbi:hypothetical protein FSP39_003362 [Pinctada imbricata]|uniref:NudC domain-containing protein 1 n=1 Tax=Pinctada imbricata TaxID=66713 RepID=A0AA88XMA8_PINIB|nr:hypothetical protein FSP39_003362 [Pinctada imbricata]